MGSSQPKLEEHTTMNLLIAITLAVLGVAAAEPGFGYYGHGYHGYGYPAYGYYDTITERGLLMLSLDMDTMAMATMGMDTLPSAIMATITERGLLMLSPLL